MLLGLAANSKIDFNAVPSFIENNEDNSTLFDYISEGKNSYSHRYLTTTPPQITQQSKRMFRK